MGSRPARSFHVIGYVLPADRTRVEQGLHQADEERSQKNGHLHQIFGEMAAALTQLLTKWRFPAL